MSDKFVEILLKRSKDNKKAFEVMHENKLYGHCIALLRMELDTMIRIIYLNNQTSEIRRDLIDSFLVGDRWTYTKKNGEIRYVTDSQMVNLSAQLHGWTKLVYRFGCSFIHLSNYHGFDDFSEFDNELSREMRMEIVKFVKQYQHVELKIDFSLNDLVPILDKIFYKINSNISYDIEKLKNFL